MRTLRTTTRFLILPICLAGCASTTGVSSKMQTVASVGDKPLPVVTGEPGSSVVADRAPPERSKQSRGRISGRIVDENGTPLADVRVRLAVGNAPGGKVIQSTTDRTGAFTLNGVRPGSAYTVIAEWEDDQERLTGRSTVRAPDTDVQISLAPAETDAPGALNANASRRVNPVSERDPVDSEGVSEDEPARKPRVNEEDLPPAPEADAVSTARTNRTASRSQREPAPRVARWRPGGSERPDPAPADPAPESDGSNLPPAMERPEPLPRKGVRASVPEDPAAVDEDGPNPLPPALEPGKDSSSSSAEPAPPPLREEKGALAQAAAEAPALLPDLPGPVEAATSTPTEPTPAAPAGPMSLAKGGEALPPPVEAAPERNLEPPVDPTSLAKAAELPPAFEVAPGRPLDPPAFEPEPARELAPGALAAASAPAHDQSIFETGSADPGPPPAEAPPADGRRRPTWKELAALAAREPTPGRTLEAGAVVASARVPLETNPLPPATAAPPRAAPRQADDGKAYCEYDSKHRRIQDFRLPDLQGRPVRFQDIDADLVLIDFWGTWCPPCIRSIPHLVELQKRMGVAKLKVVGIACEQGPPAERAAKVAQEVQRLGINYPVLLSGMDGDCPLQQALHIQAFPTLVLVDRQGRIVWRDQGATPITLARLDRFLASALRADNVRRY